MADVMVSSDPLEGNERHLRLRKIDTDLAAWQDALARRRESLAAIDKLLGALPSSPAAQAVSEQSGISLQPPALPWSAGGGDARIPTSPPCDLGEATPAGVPAGVVSSASAERAASPKPAMPSPVVAVSAQLPQKPAQKRVHVERIVWRSPSPHARTPTRASTSPGVAASRIVVTTPPPPAAPRKLAAGGIMVPMVMPLAPSATKHRVVSWSPTRFVGTSAVVSSSGHTPGCMLTASTKAPPSALPTSDRLLGSADAAYPMPNQGPSRVFSFRDALATSGWAPNWPSESWWERWQATPEKISAPHLGSTEDDAPAAGSTSVPACGSTPGTSVTCEAAPSSDPDFLANPAGDSVGPAQKADVRQTVIHSSTTHRVASFQSFSPQPMTAVPTAGVVLSPIPSPTPASLPLQRLVAASVPPTTSAVQFTRCASLPTFPSFLAPVGMPVVPAGAPPSPGRAKRAPDGRLLSLDDLARCIGLPGAPEQPRHSHGSALETAAATSGVVAVGHGVTAAPAAGVATRPPAAVSFLQSLEQLPAAPASRPPSPLPVQRLEQLPAAQVQSSPHSRPPSPLPSLQSQGRPGGGPPVLNASVGKSTAGKETNDDKPARNSPRPSPATDTWRGCGWCGTRGRSARRRIQPEE